MLMNRVLTILAILICFELGMVLLLIPWASLWTRNFFFHHYAWVSAVAKNYFVRGAVSGVGLADMGLAVYEFRRLRRQAGGTRRA